MSDNGNVLQENYTAHLKEGDIKQVLCVYDFGRIPINFDQNSDVLQELFIDLVFKQDNETLKKLISASGQDLSGVELDDHKSKVLENLVALSRNLPPNNLIHYGFQHLLEREGDLENVFKLSRLSNERPDFNNLADAVQGCYELLLINNSFNQARLLKGLSGMSVRGDIVENLIKHYFTPSYDVNLLYSKPSASKRNSFELKFIKKLIDFTNYEVSEGLKEFIIDVYQKTPVTKEGSYHNKEVSLDGIERVLDVCSRLGIMIPDELKEKNFEELIAKIKDNEEGVKAKSLITLKEWLNYSPTKDYNFTKLCYNLCTKSSFDLFKKFKDHFSVTLTDDFYTQKYSEQLKSYYASPERIDFVFELKEFSKVPFEKAFFKDVFEFYLMNKLDLNLLKHFKDKVGIPKIAKDKMQYYYVKALKEVNDNPDFSTIDWLISESGVPLYKTTFKKLCKEVIGPNRSFFSSRCSYLFKLEEHFGIPIPYQELM